MLQAPGQAVDVGLGDVDPGGRHRFGDAMGNVNGGRLTQVVNVCLEREPQDGNLGVPGQAGKRVTHLVQDPARLLVVDGPGSSDQARLGRCCSDDEPGIDGDAVTPDAGSRLQDVDARVVVCQPDQFPDVDAQLFADDRKLIRKRYVDVAVGVFHQLGHFRRHVVGDQDLPLAKHRIQVFREIGGAPGDPANNPVVGDKLDHDFAGQDALGAMGQENRGPAVGAVQR
ncbi:hypothetical protein SRABI128_05530 [Microbacterium sp. Bi128]|nr:hypothetical protein SRABI128_05530 [Microbacterium sp. Bi128]